MFAYNVLLNIIKTQIGNECYSYTIIDNDFGLKVTFISDRSLDKYTSYSNYGCTVWTVNAILGK